MPKANINDRDSVERLYPQEAFEQDAAQNSRAETAVLRGVRLVAPVDGRGEFAADKASRHVGESDPEGDALFVAPYLSEAPLQQNEASDGGPGETSVGSAASTKLEEYERFIDRIIETARSAQFKPATGAGDERLRGFHGG
jgi:hypothetical protein